MSLRGSMQKILSDPTTMEHLKYMAHLPEGWTLIEIKERFDKQLEAQKKQEALNFIIRSQNKKVVGSCGFNTILVYYGNVF